MVGDVAEFKTKEAELVLQVVSDNKTEKAEIKPSIMGGKETIQGHTKFENVSSKYELELMRQVLKFGDLNTIKFGDNTPCLMEFNLGTIKLETILAPRVEQVMDDNFYDEEYEDEAEMEEVEQ
jgi:hypothetical protein